MNLLEKIRFNAQNNPQRIVLPESFEQRTLKAADEVIAEKIAHVILIGERGKP